MLVGNLQIELRLQKAQVEAQQQELAFYQRQLYNTQESQKATRRQIHLMRLHLAAVELAIPTKEKIIKEVS